MHRHTVPFQFVISAPPGQRQQTREAFQELARQLQGVFPAAAVVCISAQQGVAVLNTQGESLDLSALPWAWVEEAVLLLGTGAFVLPVNGVRGSEVEEPWNKKSSS